MADEIPRPMTLREKHRAMQQALVSDNSLKNENIHDKTDSEKPVTASQRLSRKELYESRLRERLSEAPVSKSGNYDAEKTVSMASVSEPSTLDYIPRVTLMPSEISAEKKEQFVPRPSTAAPAAPQSDKDKARREYLAEAKKRIEAQQNNFDEKVKEYFSEAIEKEARKAESMALSTGKPKLSKKEVHKLGFTFKMTQR